jgi:hypothetical protein
MAIVNYLIKTEIQFIDVGIGMYCNNDTLGGNVRVTTCTPVKHNHIAKRINFVETEDDEYSTNIQIADMNALNAVLAVIKWKKICGFYFDFAHEHNTSYSVVTNELVNDDEENGDETKTYQT